MSWSRNRTRRELAALLAARGTRRLGARSRAPLHPRVSGATSSRSRARREVKSRLRPLIAGTPEDPDEELKGVALRCCWPDDLATGDLLEALHPWRTGPSMVLTSGSSSYSSVRASRPRRSDPWPSVGQVCSRAGAQFGPRDPDRSGIAHAAVAEIDHPEVADALSDLLWESALQHADSPLGPIRRGGLTTEALVSPAPLAGKCEARRILLKRLIAKAGEDHILWWVAHRTPGLLVLEDFTWLLENACDTELSQPERESYAELAPMLPMHLSYEAVEAWLRFRECEPVKSKLDYPLSVRLDSDEADQARKHHAMQLGEPDSNERSESICHPSSESFECSSSRRPRIRDSSSTCAKNSRSPPERPNMSFNAS